MLTAVLKEKKQTRISAWLSVFEHSNTIVYVLYSRAIGDYDLVVSDGWWEFSTISLVQELRSRDEAVFATSTLCVCITGSVVSTLLLTVRRMVRANTQEHDGCLIKHERPQLSLLRPRPSKIRKNACKISHLRCWTITFFIKSTRIGRNLCDRSASA